METMVSQKSLVDGETDNESGIYKTVEFRMYCFKVLPCSKRFCHDWTNCPFAHPGEKAKRRDPRVYHYKGVACPEMKMGLACPRKAACPFAHNVFEYWLHPNRYRTQPCNDGPACGRRVCFFAHTLDELRVPSEDIENYAPASPLEDSSESDDTDPRTSVHDIDQLIHDASCELTKRLQHQHQHQQHLLTRLAPSGEGMSMAETFALPLLHLDSFSAAAAAAAAASPQNTYTVNSLTSSLLSRLPDYEISEQEDLAEKPHYIEKSLTDLLNYENEAPQQQQQQQRTPLSSFQLQNYDTSALESGLHWNGGPPRLFVDRSRQALSNSFGRALMGSYSSSDIENLSTEFLEYAALSKPTKPFLLASQACNF